MARGNIRKRTRTDGTTAYMVRVEMSPDPRTVNLLALSWGVESLQVADYTTVDETVWFAVEGALSHGMIEHGDTVLVLAGAPQRGTGGTDVLRIVRVD